LANEITTRLTIPCGGAEAHPRIAKTRQVRNIEVDALIQDEAFSRSLVRQFAQLVEIGAVERVPLG
jgi:hypothetical protein